LLTGYTFAAIQAHGLEHLFVPIEVMRHLLRQGREGVPGREYLYVHSAAGRIIPITMQVSPRRHPGHHTWQLELAFSARGPLTPTSHDHQQRCLLHRLASTWAHEIRNPLSTIFLHTDLMTEELQQPGPEHEADMAVSLTEVKIEMARLENLLQGYLLLAHLENLQRAPVDLGDVVEMLVTRLQEQLDLHNITLGLQGIKDLGLVTVHEKLISQALCNLLYNAMEAMPQGGTVMLRGTRQENFVRLEVQDTSNGLRVEDLPWLTRPLHTITPEDSGLGLYVVQQIVAAHAGEVLVASASDVGTTFTILLPLA
jgi:two-component system sensor histidine kinase HydH